MIPDLNGLFARIRHKMTKKIFPLNTIQTGDREPDGL